MSANAGRASSSGFSPLTRRVRLPADRRTPAAARAVVRAILAEAQLIDLLDEALLLTTELATNGVMHAGTDLDIEVSADVDGLTVTVIDFALGPVDKFAAGPPPATPPSSTPATPPPSALAMPEPLLETDLSERGRGLLLVDHFASRWGTTHTPTGKGVWFRLDRWGGPALAHGPAFDHASVGSGGAGTADHTGGTDHTGATAVAVGALTRLLQVVPETFADEPLADFARRVLTRAAELVRATSATVRVDRGDGTGPQLLARYGRAPGAGTERITVPLSVSRPYSGELDLDAPPSATARPVAVLVAERLSLYLENDRLRRADLRRQSWLTFLAEASELLAQSLDVQLTMALIPQLVVPRLGRWCAVHTADEWGGFELAAATHADENRLAELHSALKESGPESFIARLRESTRQGCTLPLTAPLEGFVLPLIARGQRLGTLAVGRHRAHRHDPDEVAVLEDVSRRAALAIDNARIHDERRRISHTLQQSLLPPVLPVVSGIEFAAEYVPSGDTAEVGGDFYDVVPLPDDRWLVVVGDVSGKGVQAAAVTGLVRDVIRVLAQDGRRLSDLLVRLNDTLVERGGGRYCTLAMAEVARGADNNFAVTLYLAGHERPVLVRGHGVAEFVGAGGTALGLLRAIESPVVSMRLSPGESLIFYTDGVTERRRGRELFGAERLRNAAAPLSGYSADVTAARLRNITLGFSAESPRDDIAILVLRNEPPAR